MLYFFSLNAKNHSDKTEYGVIFFSTGDADNPYDRDYHWYRLDDNGFWSHKPGRTHATDRDGEGNRIRDPRMAVNGFIPYKFVCFMTVNRFSVNIR